MLFVFNNENKTYKINDTIYFCWFFTLIFETNLRLEILNDRDNFPSGMEFNGDTTQLGGKSTESLSLS